MSLTVPQAQALLNCSGFLARVQFAVVQQAQAICTEESKAANHVSRLARAKAVLAAPASFTAVYAQGVVGLIDRAAQSPGPAGDCDVTDAQLLALVGKLWDWYTG